MSTHPLTEACVVLICGVMLTLLPASPGAAAEPHRVRLPAVRDVWVSSHPDEVNFSMGRTQRLKLKVHEEMALLDFDLSTLRGQRILSAELWMHNVPETTAAEKERLGVPPERPDCLRKIGLSTVTSPWEEGGQSAEYQPDPLQHGATYNQASSGRRDWAYPGSKLWAVIMGNGNSVHCHGEREYQGDGWWRIAVDPRLVQAMLGGLSHGLLVAEESSTAGGPAANNYLHSREAGAYAPYLVVDVAPSTQAAVSPPSGMVVEPAPEVATLTSGAARVGLFVPESAIGYLVKMDGDPVAAWRVPMAGRTGSWQTFVLDDLPPTASLRVEVCAAGPTGLVSAPAVAEGLPSPPLAAPPTLPAMPFQPVGDAPVRAGAFQMWAYPEVTQVDPLTGAAPLEPTPDLRPRNAVWDGAQPSVRVAAARGEIAAFQLAVEALTPPVRNVRIQASDLTGPSGVIGKENLRFFREWYVRTQGGWQPEYAIPLTGPFDLPAADNAVPDQRVQSIYVDVIVPPTAAAGTYRGRLSVTAGGGRAEVEVALVVYPVTIPNQINFSPELNSYGPPGGAVGAPYFYQAHRLAQYHRCTINTVHYSHMGNTNPQYVPGLAGSGASVRVADWTEYDRLLGPLLDGSAFEGNPRGRVPVRAFYLPFHENWPLPLRDYYAFKDPPRNEAVIVRHQLEAPPIEKALPEEYKAGFRNVVRDFVAHFEEKGWTETDLQMYLNNKYYYWGATYWVLDEPTCRDDWQAMRFFAALYKAALAGPRRARFVFRGDVSRAWWQYDQLDGLMDSIYYNSEIFDLPGFARHFNQRIPDPHVYGSCNPVGASDHESAAWCLKAYALGLNGVLPWQSLGSAESLTTPDQTALIVPGDLAGYPGPVASLRVFALRRGAQDVELLRLLAQERGYSREQIGALVAQKLPLGAEFRQTFADEAAALTFGQLSAQGFAELKEGVLAVLSQPGGR